MPPFTLPPKPAPRRGLTIVEAALVLFLVATAAVVVVPRWTSTHLAENERDAVTSLRRIAAAQQAFRERAGGRSFGFLRELLGEAVGPEVRGPAGAEEVPVSPPLLADLGMTLNADGTADRGGYRFAVFLVDAYGDPVNRPGPLDPSRQAGFWIAYAWPRVFELSGRSLYVVTAEGEVFRTTGGSDAWARGPGQIPPANIFRPEGSDSPLKPPPPRLQRVQWNPVPAP